jgi:hypothetical protein
MKYLKQTYVQKSVQSQSIAQADNSNPSNNLAPVHDPIFWTILAIAVLIRVILDRR